MNLFTDFITQIDYISFLISFTLWTLSFIALSIILLTFLKKKGLLSRNKKIAKYLVILHYILVPIYFCFFSAQIAIATSLKKEIHQQVQLHGSVVSELAKIYISEVVPESFIKDGHSLESIVDLGIAAYLKNLDEDGYKVYKENSLPIFKSLVKQMFIKEVSKKAMIISKTGVKQVYETEIDALINEGQLVNIFQGEINYYFKIYYRSTIVIFILGLLIPTAEILLARRFKY